MCHCEQEQLSRCSVLDGGGIGRFTARIKYFSLLCGVQTRSGTCPSNVYLGLCGLKVEVINVKCLC
jgi:hypothetical protein